MAGVEKLIDGVVRSRLESFLERIEVKPEDRDRRLEKIERVLGPDGGSKGNKKEDLESKVEEDSVLKREEEEKEKRERREKKLELKKREEKMEGERRKKLRKREDEIRVKRKKVEEERVLEEKKEKEKKALGKLMEMRKNKKVWEDWLSWNRYVVEVGNEGWKKLLEVRKLEFYEMSVEGLIEGSRDIRKFLDKWAFERLKERYKRDSRHGWERMSEEER
ncbi:hypothetical protein L873DRAFT_1794148 [Choiromyces venosus 120613-1]|uniref:Uncharacterized protein n=1 Tax=Choiromyces venosus 120613-1 TaxID=1336337 RepID=A0A3N4J5Z5_9PEZI|nr:hypothetical protein L873DRAFT_1794148 [Choiromyces venosus 120613-1]